MSTVITHLRPLALSLALGLSAAAGLASAAQAGQTYSYETDVWPQVQAQLQAHQPQQEALATQAVAPAITDGSGASLAPQSASSVAVNGLGEHVDHTGIPVLQDRGMDN